MAEADVDLDAFTRRVLTPQGMWSKVRVLVADGAATVFAPSAGGRPEAVLSRPVEQLEPRGAGWTVGVAGEGGKLEMWAVDAPCGCGSPSKRWGTAELVAAAADARARAAETAG